MASLNVKNKLLTNGSDTHAQNGVRNNPFKSEPTSHHKNGFLRRGELGELYVRYDIALCLPVLQNTLPLLFLLPSVRFLLRIYTFYTYTRAYGHTYTHQILLFLKISTIFFRNNKSDYKLSHKLRSPSIKHKESKNL